MGLKHLITSSGWKTNSVTIRQNSSIVATTASSIWGWTNPISVLPDNSSSSVTVLDQAGTIYVFATSRTTLGHNINADEVAIVTLPDVYMNAIKNGAQNTAIDTGEVGTDSYVYVSVGSQKFLWIEFSTKYTENWEWLNYGLFAVAMTHSRIHETHLDITAANSGFILADQITHCLFTETTITDSGQCAYLGWNNTTDYNDFYVTCTDTATGLVGGGPNNRFH